MKTLPHLAPLASLLWPVWPALACLHSGCAAESLHHGKPQPPAASSTAARPPGKVLFVLTASRTQVLQNGKQRNTGYFLGEFYDPYAALTAQGYTVDIATPGGAPAPVDPESLKTKYWKEHPAELARAQTTIRNNPALQSPLTLDEALANADDYQALLVPGGQGLMNDLISHPTLHNMLAQFAANDRPVGLLCHAPAVLSQLPPNNPTFRGRTLTSVTGFEEWYIETFVMDGKARVRGIADRLESAGFHHHSAFPGSAYAVRDCNLVTSQNPYSGEEFNRLFLAALTDSRAGSRCQPLDQR